MQEYEILKHIRKYHSSGVIHDALIPFFDQDGRWRGDQIRWQTDKLPPLLKGMREVFLPSSRRTRKCRSGTVLTTSFYWQGSETIQTTYCGVDGSFVVDGNAIILAANLRHIGGHFISKTAERVDVPILTTVGGRVNLMRTFLLKAPRLRHVGGNVMIAGYMPPLLETVGGRLEVSWSFDFHAPKLKSIGGCFVPHKCTELIVPSLETVGCAFLVTHAAKKIHAPKLRFVGGDFIAGLVGQIRAPLLRNVSGNLDSHSAKEFFHPGLDVGGVWLIFPGAEEEWEKRNAARLLIRGKSAPIFL